MAVAEHADWRSVLEPGFPSFSALRSRMVKTGKGRDGDHPVLS